MQRVRTANKLFEVVCCIFANREGHFGYHGKLEKLIFLVHNVFISLWKHFEIYCAELQVCVLATEMSGLELWQILETLSNWALLVTGSTSMHHGV